MTEEKRVSVFHVKKDDSHAIAQAIYHSVTGKTEKITRSFSENYHITMSDIEQLHQKCTQMCSQWNVLGANENITVRHVDDNSQVFSSLDRFRIYDKSQTSAIEAILYEFNVLLAIPSSQKPQPYKITVKIISSLAVMEKMEMNAAPPRLLRLFGEGPITIEVDYVDYVVARNIMSTVESWVGQIKQSKKNKILKPFQENSHWIPRISSAILLCLAMLMAYFAAGKILFTDSNGNQLLAQFLVATAGFSIVSLIIGTWLGRFVENLVDRIQELSFIDLNVGDARIKEKCEKGNGKKYFWMLVTFIYLTAHGLFCSIAGTFFYEKIGIN